MTLEEILFAIVAGLTCVAALGVVVTRSLVRAAVWLLFTLIGVSLTYFLLGAEFLGAAQLIVYVGGTMVLVVFGVMLTSQGPFDGIRTSRLDWIIGSVIALSLFALLVTISLKASHPASAPVASEGALPGTGALGLSFLGVGETADATAFLLPFEIVSVHLLVVLIAAAYLARPKRARTTSTVSTASSSHE